MPGEFLSQYKQMILDLFKIRARHNEEDSQEEDDHLDCMDIVWEHLTDEERKEVARFGDSLSGIQPE